MDLVNGWHTQIKGVVTRPVYAGGRVRMELRVVPVAYYPTRRVGVPEFNHLPMPDAIVAASDVNAKERVPVPNPRAPRP